MHKLLYVDETGNNDVFIVGGLLIDYKTVEISYKRFKKSIQNIKLSPKLKQKVFIEFKATMLDREYQRIKKLMLLSINDCDYSLYFATHTIVEHFNQRVKERVYINLLNKIVNSINEDVIVVFDKFKNSRFDNMICGEIGNNENVISITRDDSKNVHGLQYIDNICSVYRKYICEDDTTFYDLVNNISEL